MKSIVYWKFFCKKKILTVVELVDFSSESTKTTQWKKIALFKESLATIQEIELLEPSAQFNADPLKVTIQSKRGISGFELQSFLEEKGIIKYYKLKIFYKALKLVITFLKLIRFSL